MPRAYRFVFAPKWLIGHVLVLAAAVAMVLLGRWQMDVSDSKHFSLLNFGYALQWWAFTLFALGLWGRILRDAARSRAASPDTSDPQRAEPVVPPVEAVAYRRYVMPQSSDGIAPAGDAELAAYNDYLAKLAAGNPAREENR